MTRSRDLANLADGVEFLAADHTKLDGIETAATADQTDAEIRTAVEAASDSNVFTDADHSKLNAIEASATADQTNAEIRAAVEAATDSNVFTDADHSKLNAVEASADVTDTANVTSAGALMDSEVTNLAQVKAFASSDYATAAQGTTADAALPKAGGALTGAVTGLNSVGTAHNNGAIFDSSGTTQLWLRDTDAASNQKNWGFQISGGSLNILRANDDRASGFATPIEIQQAPANSLVLRSDGNLNLGNTSKSQIVFQMLSTTDGANTIHFGDATSGNQMYNGYINYQHGSSPHLAIQVNDNERMRISSTGDTTLNGKFTLTPDGYVSGIQNLASINISSAGGGATRAIDIDGGWSAGESKSINWIHGNSTSNFMGSIDCSYNGTGGAFKFGKLYYNGDSSAYTMNLTATSTTTANLSVAGNITALTGNLVIGTAGKGIDFSAYGAGTNVNNNLLNDYEEGTFTPTLTIGSTVLTSSNGSARYTKIGRQVYIEGTVTRATSAGPSGNIQVRGLPFTSLSANGIGVMGNGLFWMDEGGPATNNGDTVALAYLPNGQQYLYGVRPTSSGAQTTSRYARAEELNNGRPIYFSVTYSTAA